MTHDEMIAVIQAHKEGKTIYCKAKFKSVDKWEVSTAPGFNFNAFDYKFNVTRTDGSDRPGGKHEDCDYFVLDLMGGIHSSEYKKFIKV